MTTDTITERTFDISIECNSAAFDGMDCGPELARILRKLADRIELDSEGVPFSRPLHDTNGNRCGTAEMTATDYRR